MCLSKDFNRIFTKQMGKVNFAFSQANIGPEIESLIRSFVEQFELELIN